MKQLYYVLFALTFAMTGVASAQSSTLVKKVEAKPGSLVIPYEKYELANGLTVIINEDHSDPIVHVEVTYHVGSNRETMRRTGFAHFFEHMMFQGSENVADEEHFKIVQGSGGNMNGTTNRDRTNYFETVPSNMLETALWLEADRMGFLLPAFTKKKFENQRETVKNEKDQRYASGYGMLPEVKDQMFYPYGHPYSWQTIGYVDDLNEADSTDLKNFFLKWYGPNNAILVISGDVDTKNTLALVEKYYGAIKKGPAVTPLPKTPLVLEETNIKTITSKIFAPLTYITYPTVPTFHRDEAALDVLAKLLGDGKNSPLYKNFIDNEVALQASCFNQTFEIAGEFSFPLVTYPNRMGGLNEKEMRDQLAKALKDFETTGFTEADLMRIKQELAADYYGAVETIGAKASILTQYEMLTNGRMTLDQDYARYTSVTKADVMRVYNTYIKNKNYSCIHIIPDPRLADDPNVKIKPYESVNPYINETIDKSAYEGLTYVPNVDAPGFDRSKKPVVGQAKPAVVPNFFKTTFDNGIKIIGTKSTESPRVYLTMQIKGGHLFETGKVKNGSAAMLGIMMNEGTTSKSALEVENRLKELGSTISFNGAAQIFSCYVECFKDSLKQTMALMEDMFYNPVYSEKEFKTNKKAVLGSIANANFDPSTFGARSFREFIYGTDNPIGVPSLSEYSVANKLSIDDAKNFKENFLSPNLTTISVVGDVDEKTIVESLSFLKKWENKNLTVPTFNNYPESPKNKLYLVNQDGAKQTTIYMGYRSLPYDVDGEFFKANVMNFALGGAFNSRLNLNLREDKGWTYGIRSGFSSGGYNIPGLFIINAGIKTRATDSAIAEILKELKGYVEKGITDDELDFTKRSLLGGEALNYESPFGKLGFLTQIIQLNLDRITTKRAEIIKNLTKEDINAMAKKYIDIDNLIIVCIGDDVMIQDKLEKLGLGKVKTIKL
ncbi:MAG: pitrilysin family protein [Bacteroidia bacterium]